MTIPYVEGDDGFKRFVVFGHYRYYPSGGLFDIVFDTDDLDEATKRAKEYEAQYDFVYLCDLDNGLREINLEGIE